MYVSNLMVLGEFQKLMCYNYTLGTYCKKKLISFTLETFWEFCIDFLLFTCVLVIILAYGGFTYLVN